ncbi:hypothetical protein DFH07DRAFT_960778 [Mycena maculata]|uniref:Uncharacterized protein n=1 Tax=Mycena maculata TaxID=230809 RepID=A0AAD7NAA2_9AGAR|nr:hypothetical protein DFH07DRAFT_974930 [Mycena maculata]KAJ7751943.1 hypothetical protein DFH07DRAFT_960778 [Mycena maculata]
MLGLRVWAMYNLNKMVLFSLLSAGLVAVLLAVWSVTDQTWVLATGVAGCAYAVSKHTAVRMAVAWEAQFLCDVVVFGLILLRSYRQPFKISGSILSYMVRDGALYFAVLAFANLANILMYYFGDVINFIWIPYFSTLKFDTALDSIESLLVYFHVNIILLRRPWYSLTGCPV